MKDLDETTLDKLAKIFDNPKKAAAITFGAVFLYGACYVGFLLALLVGAIGIFKYFFGA